MKCLQQTEITSDKDEINKIINLINGIRFGQITINIQNGEIVQVEKTEKFRVNEL